jgi:hypothetical protein
MGKDPAFLFYSSDFLTGTYTMTDEQVGKYIRLLCLQHQHGHLHQNHMDSIIKTTDDVIYSKFIKDSDGKYYNQRLQDEIEKRVKYTDSRSLNGSLGGRPLKAYGSDMDMNSKTICEPYENHSENVIINKKRGVGKGIETSLFDKFYKEYPKHQGRVSAVKAFSKIDMTDDLFADIMASLATWKKSEQWIKDNGQYIPLPATWLNGRRWEDELPQQQPKRGGSLLDAIPTPKRTRPSNEG